jgi:hypothetical protein
MIIQQKRPDFKILQTAGKRVLPDKNSIHFKEGLYFIQTTVKKEPTHHRDK